LSLTYPHRKKSQGVRSGDLGGQSRCSNLFERPCIFYGSVHTMKKNTEALAVTRKETAVAVNAEKTMKIYTFREEDAG